MVLFSALAIFLGFLVYQFFYEKTRYRYGTPYMHHNRECKRKEESINQLERVRFGVALKKMISFSLKKETWYDKISKWIGLIDEVQVGKDTFDKAIFVISDSRTTRELIRDQSEIQLRIQELFQFLKESKVTPARFTFAHGYAELIVTYKSKHQFRSLNGQIHNKLIRLVQTVEKHLKIEETTPRIVTIDTGINALLLALLLVGVCWPFAQHALLRIHCLDWRLIAKISMKITGVVIGMSVMALTVSMFRSSRIHLLVRKIVLGGFFALSLFLYAFLFQINVDWPIRESETVTIVVQKKESEHYRRTFITTYSIEGEDSTGTSYKVPLALDAWNKMYKGKSVEIEVKTGALGYRYIQE